MQTKVFRNFFERKLFWFRNMDYWCDGCRESKTKVSSSNKRSFISSPSRPLLYVVLIFFNFLFFIFVLHMWHFGELPKIKYPHALLLWNRSCSTRVTEENIKKLDARNDPPALLWAQDFWAVKSSEKLIDGNPLFNRFNHFNECFIRDIYMCILFLTKNDRHFIQKTEKILKLEYARRKCKKRSAHIYTLGWSLAMEK